MLKSIKITKIQFGQSEAKELDHTEYDTLTEAEAACGRALPDAGYAKTAAMITWENGDTYQMRLDIGDYQWGHISQHLTNTGNRCKKLLDKSKTNNVIFALFQSREMCEQMIEIGWNKEGFNILEDIPEGYKVFEILKKI